MNDMNIGPNDPIRLKTAAEIAFPDGSIKVSSLRSEIRRGNLKSELIAGKQYTTLNAIVEMREKCRESRKARVYISGPVKDESQPGSSSMDRLKRARDAASTISQKLKKPLSDISSKSTALTGGKVILLKSR